MVRTDKTSLESKAPKASLAWKFRLVLRDPRYGGIWLGLILGILTFGVAAHFLEFWPLYSHEAMGRLLLLTPVFMLTVSALSLYTDAREWKTLILRALSASLIAFLVVPFCGTLLDEIPRRGLRLFAFEFGLHVEALALGAWSICIAAVSSLAAITLTKIHK